jgi:hypothetical protein
MSLGDITTASMRTAFAQYAETHEAAMIQRCSLLSVIAAAEEGAACHV